METPQTVVFTQRAFNAIVTETVNKHPIETGGIFLGYVMDNGTWIVVENIAPGFKSTHHSAYFEYDADFVTYLANVVANQYKGNLQILGLWHRHPGSMDIFSSTDDETNYNYAKDSEYGSISALVNCDPMWRMTMYHVSQEGKYERSEWFVDEGDIIPSELLELHYKNPDDVPVFNRTGTAIKAKSQFGEPQRSPTPKENFAQTSETGTSHDKLNNMDSVNRGDQTITINDDSSFLESESTPYTLKKALSDIKKIIVKLINDK